MNRDDVLRMVRAVGFKPEFFSPEGIEMWGHFAQLVAAAEREACAAICVGVSDARQAALAIRARGDAA